MNNLAIRMQYIGMMALVEDQIVDCFHGGWISYDAFPRFHALMAKKAAWFRTPPCSPRRAWGNKPSVGKTSLAGVQGKIVLARTADGWSRLLDGQAVGTSGLMGDSPARAGRPGTVDG